MDGLLYKTDVRNTEPNQNELRRARFHAGWQRALSSKPYAEGTLDHLTWENLGYRLGMIFGEASRDLIDEMYDWCTEQQSYRLTHSDAQHE